MRRMPSRGLIGTILALLVWLCCDPGYAVTLERFHFKSVEGQVFFRYPLGAGWRTLRSGMTLPTGSLVQIDREGSLSYVYSLRRTKGWDGTDAVLNVKSAMNIQLHRDILRPIKLSNLFVTRIPVVKNFQHKEGVKDYFIDFRNAWDRLALFVSRDESTSDYVDDLLKRAKHEALEVGVRSGKINLLYPAHGDAEFVRRYPADFEIIWDRSRKYPGPYKVYIWPSKQERPAPVGTTRRESYIGSVPHAGSYFIQVATEDGRAWSKAHIFHLSEPMDTNGIQLSDGVLEVKSPPDDLTLISKGKRQAVRFAWSHLPHIDVRSLSLHLYRGKAKKPRIISLKASSGSSVRNLRPGNYRWQLVMDFSAVLGNRADFKKTIQTPMRQLVIRKGGLDQAIDHFARMIRNPDSERFARRIYLDETHWSH